MRITVVGSADAFNSEGRGHSCYWLDEAAREPLMIDFGGTALAGIKLLDRDPDELGAVILTHLHADHFGGLPFLHVDLTFRSRRTRPLVVLGPSGTCGRVTRLLEVAYGTSIVERAGFELELREISPGERVDVLGANVEAFAARHVDAPDQALCLRLTCADGSVVAFSGDTLPCPGLEQAARDADLLVAECTALEPPAGRHTTWADWPELAPRLGARRVLLTHLGPGVREHVTRELSRLQPKEPIVSLADDGLVVEVSPG